MSSSSFVEATEWGWYPFAVFDARDASDQASQIYTYINRCIEYQKMSERESEKTSEIAFPRVIIIKLNSKVCFYL